MPARSAIVGIGMSGEGFQAIRVRMPRRIFLPSAAGVAVAAPLAPFRIDAERVIPSALRGGGLGNRDNVQPCRSPVRVPCVRTLLGKGCPYEP